jgi:ATP-dependent DNA helicase RecG
LLDRLLAEPAESPWLEFKSNNDNPHLIGEYISALANAAMLAGRDRAYLVFGVNDETRAREGTAVRLREQKVGGENLTNWLSRMVEPRLMLEFEDFECEGVPFSVIVIEPTYDRPVRFAGVEYFRIGENKKKLVEFPEHERALWLATGRRKFEDAVALPNQSADDVFAKLNTAVIYELKNVPEPRNPSEILRGMVENRFLIDNMEGGYDITNLGAILLARDIKTFPSIAGKSVRVIKYVGRDKSKSEFEQQAGKGYAVGFSGMIRFIVDRLPSDERYIDGVRRRVPMCPETAIREVIANALIHQDFTVTGAGPVIEIYDNRIEVTNTGNSLIEPDRMLNERRSRNERLASTMRDLGLCEERGGGLDKTLLEIERQHLPAPEFLPSSSSFCVVLFGPRPFNEMSRADKLRACYHHCVLRWISRDFMSNATLRDRFSLGPGDYQAVSVLISEAIRLGRIAPADPDQGKRNARYVPYWAAITTPPAE